MVRTLVVHHDPKLLERVQKESQGKAICATSLVQALRHLSSDQLSFSGIFLTCEDLSYSLLKFIEASRLRRPLTPIHILHSDDLAPSPGNILFDETLADGWIRTQSKYQEWTQKIVPLSNHLSSQPRLLPTKEHQRPGFTAIPITDLNRQDHYPYDLFLLGEDGGLRLFAIADSLVDQEYLRAAADQSQFLYVHEDQQKEYRTRLHNSQKNVMNLTSIPAVWKSSEIISKSKALLAEVKQGGLSDALVEQTGEMLGGLFKLVNDLQTGDPESLARLIRRASEADQTSLAIMFSFLMCRMMAFEKNSTVEILGIAAFFQDLGLYETPFGDLSKKKYSQMTIEEQNEYQRHPIRSVDILEQFVALPQVTLQVIRQQHERKDRTGFPSRITSTQLHPMAEVLSLINSYADYDSSVHGDFASYLKNDVFPHYSDRVLEPFKKVLKALATK